MVVGMDSPVGPLKLTSDGRAITSLEWAAAPAGSDDPLLSEAVRQLQAYFAARLEEFDLPLAPVANQATFQQRFASALCAIPFGETRSYGDLAKTLDVSAQAIGQACGANRIPILIPCHRVLAAGGLGGYSGAGGIETKIALLKHEGAASLLI